MTFFRKHGILCIAVGALILWTSVVWLVASMSTKAKVTKKLTSEYDIVYEQKMNDFREEVVAIHTPTEDQLKAKELAKEADCIAKVIGTMSTKQMKLTMLWNILMRVDSPYYPNTIEEVVNQPSQWMFYKENNPIRDDDVALAKVQLQLWHEGRYPAGLSSTFVYGEWSEHDYVLRDSWDKNYKTNYWRMPDT